MNNKPCPICGAKSTPGGWACGSVRGSGGLVFHRGNECHIRELRAERDALKAKVKKLEAQVQRYVDQYNESIRRGTI
jgi:hypothetical protein